MDSREEVLQQYSGNLVNTDVRLTQFAKLINVLNSAYLSLVFVDLYLQHQGWWQVLGNGGIPDSDKTIFVNEYLMFNKIGLVHSIFSSIESTFRIYVQHIHPNGAALSRDNFDNIYTSLFASHLTSFPAESKQLFDLLRLVRNSIHTNGVYSNRQGNDQNVDYKGVRYSFRHDTPIDSITWELLISLIDDLRVVMFEITQDPLLTGIAMELHDPFS